MRWLMGALDHVMWSLGWFSAKVTVQHTANEEREALFDRVLLGFRHSDDWHEESNCDYLFVQLGNFVRKIRVLPMIEPRDRGLLWFSMAEYRRQLCYECYSCDRRRQNGVQYVRCDEWTPLYQVSSDLVVFIID